MTDETYNSVQEFAAEFRALVRKHMPQYPVTDEQYEQLTSMQDQTSCFSPAVWDPKPNLTGITLV